MRVRRMPQSALQRANWMKSMSSAANAWNRLKCEMTVRFRFSILFSFYCGVACLPIRVTLLCLTCVVHFITIQFLTSMRSKKMQKSAIILKGAWTMFELSLHENRAAKGLSLPKRPVDASIASASLSSLHSLTAFSRWDSINLISQRQADKNKVEQMHRYASRKKNSSG